MKASAKLARQMLLADRASEHLLAVRTRFLGTDCSVPEDRMRELLESDTGVDRLESFSAKFSRMQDLLMDKLVPVFLEELGERAGPAIDNFHRLERLELIQDADGWLEMRQLRNMLVHEYFEDVADLAPIVERACLFTEQMTQDFQRIKVFAVERGLTDPLSG